MTTVTDAGTALAAEEPKLPMKRRFLALSLVLIVLHLGFMLFRYGQLPFAPIVDEVIINDPAISLALGHGYVAESFTDSKYGLDRVYAHFPPMYPYTEALAFRLFGVSVYSLRLTTTVMSLGSTIILLLLLYRLCVFGLVNWDVALLVQALYCTNASFLAQERTARMESMISFLVLLSLFAIVHGITVPVERRSPSLLAAGLFGALTLAVHPEAVTAVLLLVTLMLFLVPASRAARLGSMALFVIIPVVVGLSIYRANSSTAVRQFLAIARGSNRQNPSSYEWMMDALHSRDISTISRNMFLMLILVLLAAPAVAYLWNRRRVQRGSVQYRMCASVGVAGLIEITLTIFVLRMVETRCVFLFGALLVCNAVCLWGSGPLRHWEAAAGWAVVLLQCVATGIYLYPRHDRIANADANRFRSLVQRLPPGPSVATTPGLWLDMKEANRPFTLIMSGLDGEISWHAGGANPLSRFDVVVLEHSYSENQPWLNSEAQEGRALHSYQVGGSNVDVYIRARPTANP